MISLITADDVGVGFRSGVHALDDYFAGESVGCMGIIVDAKGEGAERFYASYDFATVEGDVWPHRMFIPMATARAAADSRAGG